MKQDLSATIKNMEYKVKKKERLKEAEFLASNFMPVTDSKTNNHTASVEPIDIEELE